MVTTVKNNMGRAKLEECRGIGELVCSPVESSKIVCPSRPIFRSEAWRHTNYTGCPLLPGFWEKWHSAEATAHLSALTALGSSPSSHRKE